LSEQPLQDKDNEISPSSIFHHRRPSRPHLQHSIAGMVVAPGRMIDSFLSIPDAESLPLYRMVLKLACVCAGKLPPILTRLEGGHQSTVLGNGSALPRGSALSQDPDRPVWGSAPPSLNAGAPLGPSMLPHAPLDLHQSTAPSVFPVARIKIAAPLAVPQRVRDRGPGDSNGGRDGEEGGRRRRRRR
jgi:hypothetical protein